LKHFIPPHLVVIQNNFGVRGFIPVKKVRVYEPIIVGMERVIFDKKSKRLCICFFNLFLGFIFLEENK
jgi:hypothetical protein